MQAIDFVRDPLLLLSFTSSAEITGSSWGSYLRRKDTPLGVSVERSNFGIKSLGSIAMPPIRAQKLFVIVNGCCRRRSWLSGSARCSTAVRSYLTLVPWRQNQILWNNQGTSNPTESSKKVWPRSSISAREIEVNTTPNAQR